ncbi:MAG: DUF3515 family protein [Mycobacteriales bacterium]
MQVAAPTPAGTVAARCRTLVAALPDDVVLGQHRRATSPSSPYTAAFGSPAVVVRCGAGLPPHDPTSTVEAVDGVGWLVLPASGGAEHFVVFSGSTHLAVDIPHAYLPANILPALSPVVQRYG